jgi:short-subunit dehydrogenase
MENNVYAGKVVVITGASCGFGRGVALELAGRQANLILAARSKDLIDDLAAECEVRGAQARAIRADVSILDDMNAVLRAALDFGGLDVWINNAGAAAIGNFAEIPIADHHKVIETDLLGTIYGSYLALGQFQKQKFGTLINVASMIGKISAPYYASYAAAKHGVVGLSAALRQEMSQNELTDIKICTVLPMAMDTEFFEHAANYSGRKAVPIPPLNDANQVVDAIVNLIAEPKDEVMVGKGSQTFSLTNALNPGLTQSMMAANTHKAQMQDAEPAANTQGNLHQASELDSRGDLQKMGNCPPLLLVPGRSSIEGPSDVANQTLSADFIGEKTMDKERESDVDFDVQFEADEEAIEEMQEGEEMSNTAKTRDDQEDREMSESEFAQDSEKAKQELEYQDGDVIDLLMADHRKVEGLFEEFENSRTKVQRRKLLEKIITELSIHAAAEEKHVYPAYMQEDEDMTQEAIEEHHVVKMVLKELSSFDGSEENVKAKVKVLSEMVQHHVEEEESEMFPEMRKMDLDLMEMAEDVKAEKEKLLSRMKKVGDKSKRKDDNQPARKSAKQPTLAKGKARKQAQSKANVKALPVSRNKGKTGNQRRKAS